MGDALKITRPVVQYQGGKYRIAPWIISYFPQHKIYCEPFGGGASVLMRKERSATEIYNDLSTRLVTIFKVLRDPEKSQELKRMLELTPWSRQEYYESFDCDEENERDVEKARKFLVRAFMGISSGSLHKPPNGFSTQIPKDNYIAAQPLAWVTYPKMIPAFCARLKGVIIENRDAERVIKQFDTDQTLHYVDPPYLLETWRKSDQKAYTSCYIDTDHERLLNLLKTVKGYVVLSGYDSELYRDTLVDWRVEKKETINQRQDKRMEILFISPKTSDAIGYQKRLF